MAVEDAAAEASQYCDDCPLRNRPYVVGYGHSKAPFLVVGTAPGASEEIAGVAFTGERGKLVRGLLEDLGIDPDEIFFTNVVKRRPAENGKNRKPNQDECWKCGSHLVSEIVRHRPLVILALGSIPFTFLTQSKLDLKTMRGLPIPTTRYAMTFNVIPTFDPSYVQRKGGLLSDEGSAWIEDLEEFARLVRSSDRDG